MTGVQTCALPIFPSVTAIPATSNEIKYIRRQGWNSHSRTVNPIAVGEGLNFSCATGISGLIVGLASAGFTLNTSSYHHGFSVDSGGVKILENGIVTDILFPQQLNSTEIRLYRQDDNTIVYYAEDGDQTYIYKSNVTGFDDRSFPLFGFAWIYSSGDVVTDYELITGQVQFGAA